MIKNLFKVSPPRKSHESTILGFSLAEATITLAVLGIIASITIPSVMSRTADTRRVKLKKALEVYSNAIIIMVNENGIKPNKKDLDNWGKENDCANVRQYFKIVQNGNNNCQFRTSDGVWWDFGSPKVKVSSLSNTLVAFNQSDLDRETGWDEGTSNKAFFFHTEFDDKGKARIQDNAYSNYIGDMNGILDCAKTYAFINKKEMYDYYTVCPSGGERKSCVSFDYNEIQKKYHEAFYGNKSDVATDVRNNCSQKGEKCGITMKSEQLKNGNWLNHKNCSTRGYCDDDEYRIAKGTLVATNVSVNLGGTEDHVYSEKYEWTTKTSCNISATTHADCKGDWEYHDEYVSDTGRLQVDYTDSSRTKIKKVWIYNVDKGYWSGSKSYNCDEALTVADCINKK